MNFKNFLLQNHWANFNQFWYKASLGEDSNEKTISYHKVYIFSSLNQLYEIIICVYRFELFSQVSDVAHGPLVEKNFNLANNLWTVSARALIFHMSIPCDKIFPWFRYF